MRLDFIAIRPDIVTMSNKDCCMRANGSHPVSVMIYFADCTNIVVDFHIAQEKNLPLIFQRQDDAVNKERFILEASIKFLVSMSCS